MSVLQRSSSVPEVQKQIANSNNRCVCEICTCGRHRCPQPHIPFKAETTNHHYYKPYDISTQKPHKLAYKLDQRHYDPDLLKSTYRVNYTPKHCPAEALHPKYTYQPNNLKFYDETEYNKNYVPNKIVIEAPAHRPHYRPNTARFQDSTTYKQQFKNKRVQQSGQIKRYAYQTNTLPFYGNTTYADYYQPYQIEANKPVFQGKYRPNTARFEGKSSYRDQYQAPHLEQDRRCLIDQLPARPRQCSPGKSHLHYHAKQNRWD